MAGFEEQLVAAHGRYASKRPRSAELHERARTVMPGGSTRSVLDMQPFPFRVASAHGARLTDVDGHEYVDFLGDYSAGLLGHDPGPVEAAVTDALEHGWSYGGVHTDEVRFAEAVVERFPSIEQVRFTNSGTEANLMAIQLARHHTRRDRVVVMDRAYHGGLLYFGHGGEALLAPFEFDRLRYNDVGGVSAIDDGVAAVLVEPMMGAAGCIAADPVFLRALRDRCDEVGALLVFDEVMTSRMSTGGAQQRLGITPDLTTLGKYLAGGMTFGAFGGRADVMAAFDPERGGSMTHGGTFNNNVVTMAAGAAAMRELLDEATLESLFERGERFRAAVADVLDAAPLPMCVSGYGSLLTIHTVPGPVTSPDDLDGGDAALKELVVHGLTDRGFYLAPRGYMALSAAITDDDCTAFVAALSASIDAIAS
ncbi:MAG: aminotransferase class III-fold pyridoxal phosphate-dependent enzyme [Ilumatobacter fluminis]|uniref:aspartate aminotransferase family protein n=1 Tax=Ilumatobacter fluminis TaxID=467091 RepID=UPI0032EAF3DA